MNNALLNQISTQHKTPDPRLILLYAILTLSLCTPCRSGTGDYEYWSITNVGLKMSMSWQSGLQSKLRLHPVLAALSTSLKDSVNRC